MESGKYRIKRIEYFSGKTKYVVECKYNTGEWYTPMFSVYYDSVEEARIMKDSLDGFEVKRETIVS